jgi:hypothetical protein
MLAIALRLIAVGVLLPTSHLLTVSARRPADDVPDIGDASPLPPAAEAARNLMQLRQERQQTTANPAVSQSQNQSAATDNSNISDESHDFLWPGNFYAWEQDSLGEEGDGLTFNHMPKAGGSFIREVIQVTVPNQHVHIEDEFETLHADDADRFTIGSVRNPCEYYLSLYSFGAMGGGLFRRFVPPALYVLDSPQQLYEWLKYIMGTQRGPNLIGVESLRIAKSYGNPSIMNHIPAARPMGLVPEWNLAGVEAALRTLNTSSVDCWVKTESLEADLQSCLSQYEMQSGVNLDWVAFKDALGKARHNSSPHRPCADMFTKDAEDLVLHFDHHIFEKFGYWKCCK